MSHIKNILFVSVMAAAITLSGCTDASPSASVSQPQETISAPAVSQPAESDVSIAPPETPPTFSEPEPEPVAPPTTAEPEPCKHAKTNTTVTQAATCTAQGHGNAVCSTCGEVVASATIPPLGHDYQQTVETKATCETDGSRTSTCTRCGDTKNEPIAAIGHTWSSVSCSTPAVCQTCGAASPEAPAHSWVVKYAMGTPECQWCGTKYTFDTLKVQTTYLDVPILVGSKSITLIDFNCRFSAFEGPFTPDSPCRLDITIDGLASNACTMTRSSHLIAPDGTKISSIYDTHGTTNPVCDGSFTEMFSFNLPASTGTYNFVFSAQ